MLQFCTLLMSLFGMKKFIFSLKFPEEMPQVSSAGADLFTQNNVHIKTLQESRFVGEDNESCGASSPLCWFNNKEFLCITRTVKHNYILPVSTVIIQLHVSVLYVDHLLVEIFNLQISHTRCVGHLCGPGGDRDLVVSIVGTMTPELLEVNFL